MSTEAPDILLTHYLKALKLPTFQPEHQKLARLRGSEQSPDAAALEREDTERPARPSGHGCLIRVCSIVPSDRRGGL